VRLRQEGFTRRRQEGFTRLRQEGFTLIELLMVMAIIGILASLMLFAIGSFTGKAKKRRTEALVDRLNTFITEYQRQTGELPADGIDTKVRNEEGVSLRGSAALYYALTREFTDAYYVAGVEKLRAVGPIGTFESADLREDEENPGVFYIIDGYGQRMHYDNQTKRIDLPEPEEEFEDEERLEDSDLYGRWKSGSGYELWSMGMRTAYAEGKLKPEIEDEDEDEE
jgi:prepilin-type N-terminal cleavage/methylation domain-containing protein